MSSPGRLITRRQRPRGRLLLTAILLLTGIALGLGGAGAIAWNVHRSAAPRWQPFEVAGAQFEVPATPAPDPARFPATTHAYSARLKKPDRVYSVGTFPVPVGADTDRFLNESLAEIVQGFPGMVERFRSDAPHDVFPGRRVFADGPDGGLASRVVMVGDRAYHLTVTGEGVSEDSAGVTRFLDSFALADPELADRARTPAAADPARMKAAAEQAKAMAEGNARLEQAKREHEEAERKAREAFAAARYDGPPVPAPSTLKGLVLYMPLDETAGESATDTVGGKPLGKLGGGAKFVPGVRGNGLDVTAAGAKLDLSAAAAAFRFGPADPYTVAVWYRAYHRFGYVLHASSPDNVKARMSILLGWGKVIGFAESQPYVADPKSGFKLSDARLEAGLDQARADDDRWHHFAMTHAGKGSDEGKNLYIDGRLVRSRRIVTQIDLKAIERVQVGGPSPDAATLSSTGFTGMVDELCVFDRALTADEVKKLAGR
jgi:hypothetical protein